MKKIVLNLAFLLTLTNLSFAQTNTDEYSAMSEKGKVTLYSVEDQDAFSNLFENWNVGNLHFYSKAENTKEEAYYFKGKQIEEAYKNFLSNDLKTAVMQPEAAPYAVAAVRGEGLSNYYILRLGDSKNANTLVLYELENNQLAKKKVLAYARKKGNRQLQLDTWMQDLNGDTRLDLIQKKRVVDKNGKVKKMKTKVFTRTRKGKFKRNRKIKLSEGDYQMQVLKQH